MKQQVPQRTNGGFEYIFSVESQVIKDFLYKNVHDSLEGYLREQLHNSFITLRFELKNEQQTASQSDLPFTSVEKFNYMLAKNKSLKLLQEVFDLHTD